MSLHQRLASLLLLPILAQTPVPSMPSPLNGVWHITGNHQQKQLPQLSASLQVHGTQIFAQGWLQLQCSGSPTSANGGNFGISGTLAPDGTFNLSTPADSRASDHITLTGHAPSPSADTWSGTYRITNTSPNCATDDKDTFEAHRLDPLSGTYTGSAFTFPGASGNVSLSLTIAQAPAITSTIRTGAFVFYIPLTANIHIKGSPCFTHGTATANPSNRITGELAHLTFTMDDGSQLDTASLLMTPTAQALDLISANVRGGKCDQNGYIHGILTRP